MEKTTRDALIKEAAARLQTMPRGDRGQEKQRICAMLGCSPATFDRISRGIRPPRKPRVDAGESRSVDAAAALRVLEIKEKAVLNGEQQRSIPTKQAIKRLEMQGEISPGALDESAVNRIARSMGVTKKRRCRRMDARTANAVHMFDGSGSEHFYIAERTGDADAVLGIRASNERVTKNRREKVKGGIVEPGRPLVYYYAVVDLHSRLVYAEPVIAYGENAEDSAAFLERAWRQKPGHAMAGLPDIFYTDNGPIGRGEAGVSLFAALDIQLETHMPRNARAKGAVERVWRTLFQQFEADFLLFKGQTVLFSEMKRMFQNYIGEYNRRTSPGFYACGLSREQAYTKSLAGREVRLIPDETTLLDLMQQTAFRVVDNAGCITWDTKEYEIVDCPNILLGEKALCRRNVRGAVQVRNPKTLTWYDTKEFMPVEFGTFRGFKNDVNDELRARAVAAPQPKGFLYEKAEAGAETEANIVNLAGAREAQIQGNDRPGFNSMDEALYYMADAIGMPVWKLAKLYPERGARYVETIESFLKQNLHDRAAIEQFAQGLFEITRTVVNR